jgi:hypothetical protein
MNNEAVISRESPPAGRLVKFAPEPVKLVAVTTPVTLTLPALTCPFKVVIPART